MFSFIELCFIELYENTKKSKFILYLLKKETIKLSRGTGWPFRYFLITSVSVVCRELLHLKKDQCIPKFMLSEYHYLNPTNYTRNVLVLMSCVVILKWYDMDIKLSLNSHVFYTLFFILLIIKVRVNMLQLSQGKFQFVEIMIQ